MSSVVDENTLVSWAAWKHGIPKSNHISGKVKHGDKPEPKQLLSAAEKEEFSSFLFEVAQAGYGKLGRK